MLGKSFKNYYVTEYSRSVNETTTILSFPHKSVCRIHEYWQEYWDDGDKESATWNKYYGYTVKGNNIYLYDLDTEDEYGTYTISGSSLLYGSDVYLDNGTVELDPSLDNRIPPEGKRSYIPTGWYDGGLLQPYVAMLAGPCYDYGDYNGMRNVPQEVDEFLGGTTSGIHVVDEHTIETAFQAVTLTRCDAYDTLTYGSYTYYFYFYSAYYTYSYRLIEGTVYLKDNDGVWAKAGTYSESNGILSIGSPNDELVCSGSYGGFKRVNYNGGYRY